MKISEISFNDLIPGNMRDDSTIKGFVAAFDHVLGLYRSKVGLVTIFDHLDMLTDAQLDAVAAAIDLPWYDTSFDRTARMEILQNYLQAYYKAGTPEAIEGVLTYIFNNVQLVPWYEYNGNGFHYKLVVSNTVDENRVRIVVNTMRRITPVVSVLDKIEKSMEANSTLYAIGDARRLMRTVTVAPPEGGF